MVASGTLSGSIPEVLFFAFQMTFAIITPALMVGAFVERVTFAATLIFSALWLLGDLAVGRQLAVQFGAGPGAAIYSAIATFVILKIVGALTPLRVTDQQENEGLDLVLHDEAGYRL